MEDWAAQSSQVQISENPLSVTIDNPQDIRLFQVGHRNEIMLPVPAFHEVFGNFEQDIFIDALSPEASTKSGCSKESTEVRARIEPLPVKITPAFILCFLSHALNISIMIGFAEAHLFT